jgi:TatD DNase family protein
MTWIDTHAHIYSTELQPNEAGMMERAKNAGISQVLMPAIDSATHAQMLRFEHDYPGYCVSMMGLHPCSVGANYEAELSIAKEYLSTRKFVAIGEIGLDFYWDISFKEQQYTAFRRQIEWALEHSVPVCIHSRSATGECIEVVREYRQAQLRGVFHCFSGTLRQASELIDIGFYLGVGGVITFKNAGLDKIMKDIGLEHVILETDAPYLAPVPFRGKTNEPAYIPYIAQRLADIKETSLDVVAQMTNTNAKKLFGL